jgi:hypothetical protein
MTFPAGTYATLPALSPGDIWEFDPAAIVTCKLDIRVANVCISGGIFRQPTKLVQGFGDTIGVYAPDVVINGVRFEGGDIQLSTHGGARAQFINTVHIDRSNAAMYLWGSGCDGTLISGFDIQPAAVAYASVIGAQCDYGSPGVIIRDGTFDQGTDGHFGIEMIETNAPLIENVSGAGGECLMSFPRSSGTVVRGSTFDLRGMNSAFPANPGWGIEFASSTGCVATGNTVFGDGTSFDQHFVACDTNGDYVTVNLNIASDITALVDGGGLAPQILDNCLTNVGTVLAFASEAPGYVLARNGPC